MASFTAIIPLLNRRVTTFPGPVWYFADDVCFKTISEPHFAASHKYGGSLQQLLTIGTKCIQISGLDAEPSHALIRKVSLCSCYTLTHFARTLPPAFKFAAVLSDGQKAVKVVKTFDVPETVYGAALQSEDYRIKDACSAADVKALYKVCAAAYDKHAPLATTIERYFSGRSNKILQDKIIDSAIALETLLRGTTELRYRFSLYHSLISCDLNDREEAFKLFQLLYDTRSAIVHGDGDRAATLTAKIEPQWPRVKALMDRALFYYLVFLNQKPPDDWDKHLQRLALGFDERISSEGLQP